MWFIIFAVFFLASFLCVAYLACRVRKFGLSALVSISAVALSTLILTLAMNFINAFVCIIHLVLFWIIVDIVAFFIKKIFKKTFSSSRTSAVAIFLTVAYLLSGWFFAHHVFTTKYIIETDKTVEPLRIVHFADSHMGTTFNAKKFKKYVEKMQNENPDVVLITGDFVDDDTSRNDMLESCKALSLFNAKYGVFFSYGNHDKGYKSEEKKGWKNEELKNALEENGVKILEDENVFINENFCIIGRKDLSFPSRLSMERLTAGIKNDAFKIVMDHQPADYVSQEKSGVDLVLSGHTHGGQLIPITYVGEWIGANCKTYGHEKRGGTNFIVTSGISDWALKFKTGCKSEYVVIDVIDSDITGWK